MTPEMNIQSFRERYWFTDTTSGFEGEQKSTYYGRLLKIDIFIYPGGVHGPAFTQLSTYLAEHTYRVKLDRCYHPRWRSRLASQFEDLVWTDANKRSALP